MSKLSTGRRAAGTGQRAVGWAPLAVILCGDGYARPTGGA